VLRGIARAHGATPAQIALAWVRGRSGINSVLISVRSPAQLRELLRAPGLRLPARTWNRLTALSEAPTVRGARSAHAARRTSHISSANGINDRATN
jgi:aryl-alcohol dehydrogenase-like predicted oxidoreductase